MIKGTYFFPKPQLTIVDPTIEEIKKRENINESDDGPKENTVSLIVYLVGPDGSKAAPEKSFDDIPMDSETWEDCNLVAIVTKRLATYKI